MVTKHFPGVTHSCICSLKNTIMKNIIFSAVIGLLLLTACSKSSQNLAPGPAGSTITVVPASSVPSVVITSFNNSFSGATEVEWQHNSSTSFTSQFNMTGQRHEASFDNNGHQSSHSVICLTASVPQAVLDAFRQKFPTDNVYEWKLTNAGDWKAHFMRGTVKWEATFSAAGVFVSVEHA